MVKPKPATAKGTAKAIAGPIPWAPWFPSIKIIAARALVLFETVEDALATIKAGVDIKEINLGSSAYKEGKVNVTTGN